MDGKAKNDTGVYIIGTEDDYDTDYRWEGDFGGNQR